MTDRAELRKLDELDADPAAAIQRLIDEAKGLRATKRDTAAAYFDGKVSGLIAALSAVQSSPWVSVKDRLPPEGEFVLVWPRPMEGFANRWHEARWTEHDQWDSDAWHSPLERDDVLWWMPMPKEPKE